jgi:Fe-S cluster biosynthesis and repair protein YggX
MDKDQIQFLKYVRTKMVFSLRLRNETDVMGAVYISTKEIEKRFFKYNRKDQIRHLINAGELEVTQHGKAFNYKALKPGGFDLSLLETKPLPDDRIIKIMVNHLKNVNMPPDAERTEYFDLFLKYKLKAINLFFKVDDFSGRVYTPVTTQHRIHRPNLLLYGKETTGLDVQTMQPLLLGKILYSQIGENDFSHWIEKGNDIYLMLKERSGINTRDEAKKRFFEILFSFPNKDLAKMFGNANWINWINEYKSKPEPRNKKVKYLENGSISYHNNLAWLLQNTEVKVMRKVWEALTNAGIPFLSVHDEVIIQRERANEAYNLFSEVMGKEFTYFKINNKAPKEVRHDKPDNEVLSTIIKVPGEAISMTPALEWDLNFNFKNITNKPIRISQAEIINNPEEFIYSHLQTCQNNKGNRTFLPYYERMKLLERLLTVKEL